MNWPQLQTILWLRWRLTRNQWVRSEGLGAVIAIALLIGTITVGGLLSIGGFFAATMALRDAPVLGIQMTWMVATFLFLLFWSIGLMTELQRSETIDLQRLLHLPVALGQMFVINFLASHLALSIILTVPAMLGLALGLAWARDATFLLLVPLVLSMVFMITAWTYCLRGWLAAMMTNPRRRRAVIMGITLGFILLAQIPNLYFNVVRRSERADRAKLSAEERAAQRTAERESVNRALEWQNFIPPFWVAAGAKGLVEGRPLPALLGILGCACIGVLGLRRAYRSTLRFYHGETGGQAPAGTPDPVADAASAAPPKPGSMLLEQRYPFVPEQALALALATFRSLLRAPEVKMQWATGFVVMLVIGSSVLFRRNLNLPEVAKPFMATGAAAMSLFFLFQFYSNQFGFDRAGFRSLVLSPAERRWILLGKNLANLPVGLIIGLVILGALAVGLGLGPLTFAASVLQLVAMLAVTSMAGNLISIFVPYRIEPGTMKPTKMPAAAMIMMIFAQFSLPIVLAPIFCAPLAEFLWSRHGLGNWLPVNLIFSAVFAALALAIYWLTLPAMGRLLHRRETKILARLSAEVE